MSVKIDDGLDRVLLVKFLKVFLDVVCFGCELFDRLCPLAIQIYPWEVAPRVALYDSVRIYHGDDHKVKLRPKYNYHCTIDTSSTKNHSPTLSLTLHRQRNPWSRKGAAWQEPPMSSSFPHWTPPSWRLSCCWKECIPVSSMNKDWIGVNSTSWVDCN